MSALLLLYTARHLLGSQRQRLEILLEDVLARRASAVATTGCGHPWAPAPLHP